MGLRALLMGWMVDLLIGHVNIKLSRIPIFAGLSTSTIGATVGDFPSARLTMKLTLCKERGADSSSSRKIHGALCFR